MIDISKSTNEVFSWERHSQIPEQAEIEYVKRLAASNCMKAASSLNRPDYWRGKTVLDAGCGGGLKTNSIAQCGAKLVVGVDGSKAALKAAARLAGNLGNKNTLFVNAFLEDVAKTTADKGVEKFDHILNAQVIHHTQDWQGIIKQFSELLVAGGHLQMIWVDPSLGIRHGHSGLQFLIKNKIAFHLGRTPRQRTNIGRFLFSRWDEHLRAKWQIEDDSFYADRYAAFYRVITLSRMLRALRRNGLEVIESYPPISADEYKRQGGKRNLTTAALRLHQFFLSGGSERHLVCRKHG